MEKYQLSVAEPSLTWVNWRIWWQRSDKWTPQAPILPVVTTEMTRQINKWQGRKLRDSRWRNVMSDWVYQLNRTFVCLHDSEDSYSLSSPCDVLETTAQITKQPRFPQLDWHFSSRQNLEPLTSGGFGVGLYKVRERRSPVGPDQERKLTLCTYCLMIPNYLVSFYILISRQTLEE